MERTRVRLERFSAAYYQASFVRARSRNAPLGIVGFAWLSNGLVYELGKSGACSCRLRLCPSFSTKIDRPRLRCRRRLRRPLKNVQRSRVVRNVTCPFDLSPSLFCSLRSRGKKGPSPFASLSLATPRFRPDSLSLFFSTCLPFFLSAGSPSLRSFLHAARSFPASVSLCPPVSLSVSISVSLCLSLALCHTLFVAHGNSLSYSTRTGRVPEIIVRIDPHAGACRVNLFSCTGRTRDSYKLASLLNRSTLEMKGI